MPGVLAAIKVAFLSTKAQSLAANEEYEQAFHVLEKIYELWGVSAPSSRITVEINLLLALVSLHTGRKELAANAAESVARQLANDGSKFNFESKCYMIQYASDIFLKAGGSPSQVDVKDFTKYVEVDIDIRRVRPDLVRRFSYSSED